MEGKWRVGESVVLRMILRVYVFASIFSPPTVHPSFPSVQVGNLRDAKATDTYITRPVTEGFVEFEPLMTIHAFRYVEVTGLPFVPDLR